MPQLATAENPWKTALPDWADRLMAGLPLVPDLPLYKTEAARGLRVFKKLRLPDVVDQPTFGEAGAPWLFKIVEALFGSFDRANNRRMITEFFLLIPKKNSKSTAAAGMMVTAICINKRPQAEFNIIAPTVEVAGISYRQARGIIRLDPFLNDLFHVQDNIRKITHRKTGAYLQVKAAESDTVTGGKPVGTLIDETHLFALKPRAADLFIEVRGALAARNDGFLIQISTQSKDAPRGVFKQELARARDVRDGKLQLPKPLLPILYELPDGLDWRDESTWRYVNPNLGRSVDENFLRSSLIDAERKGPHELALFGSQHFNCEIGLQLKTDRWSGAEHWQKNAIRLPLDELLDRAENCVIGIDGGGLDDLLGLAVLAKEAGAKDNWLLWSHAWAHVGVLARRPIIASTLRDFEASGDLTIVDDSLTDLSDVVDIARQVQERGLLAAVAVDPAGLGELVDRFAEINVSPELKNLIGVPQGWPLMNAIKTCERKLADGTLKHGGAGLMAWACANLKIEPTATGIRATKQNAGDLKIDPAIAMFNAACIIWQVKPAPQFQIAFA